MKYFTIIFFCSLLFCSNVLSQKNDSIFELGGEDNWDNVEIYKKIISNKIDSAFKVNKTDTVCGNLIICFIITEKGKVDSCEVKKSISPEIDSLMIKTICNLDFKKAAVFSFEGKPYTIRFTLPVKISLCGKKDG